MGFWLLLLLVVFLIAALPTYPYSRSWGFGPAGIIVLLLLIWFLAVWLGWLLFALPWAAAPVA